MRTVAKRGQRQTSYPPFGNCPPKRVKLVLQGQGQGENALREVEAEPEPEKWARLRALTIIFYTLGRRDESDHALDEFTRNFASDAAYQIAETHAVRGELDVAFEWLEKARTQRDPGLATVLAEPTLAPLHADPRWTAFLAKMGLADRARMFRNPFAPRSAVTKSKSG